MIEQRLDGRRERSELEPIAGRQRRRQRPILGPRPEVARAEDDRRESVDVPVPAIDPPPRDVWTVWRDLAEARSNSSASEGRPASRTSIVGAARHVHAVQAGRQRRRIVGDHQIARLQEIDEPRSRRVRDASVRVDDEQPGVARPLDGSVGAAIIGAASAGDPLDSRPDASLLAKHGRGDRVGELARGRLPAA